MLAKNINCFLIDDDKDDQEIFLLALKSIGIPVECQTADDGYLALRKFQEEPGFIPDFIFLDLNMPRVNGLQCLTEIKKNSFLKKVPVIIYTTSSHHSDQANTKQLGAEGFITKCTDIGELCHMLRNIFSRHVLAHGAVI